MFVERDVFKLQIVVNRKSVRNEEKKRTDLILRSFRHYYNSLLMKACSSRQDLLLVVEPEQVDRMEVPVWCHKCKCVGPSPEELTI